MSDQLLVATRKGLFQYERNNSGAWNVKRLSFWGDNVALAVRDPRDGSIYASLEHGHFGAKLHKSTNDGESWEELPAPAYPEGEMLEPSEWDMYKEPRPASTELIWALAAGGDDQPGRIWAGTIPGGLFLSEDEGNSWTLQRTLWDQPDRKKWFGGGRDRPGIHSLLVNPNDSNHVVLGVSCGGVWETKDSGKSWANRANGMRAVYMPPDRANDPSIQDPHCLAWSPNVTTDMMWAQHHNGIFVTIDGCENWNEIEDVKPSVFGFPVVCHPKDPNIAWFIPAHKDEFRIPVEGKVVVTRTSDGGQTFEQLTNGLPQKHAYDLVFRHALDIDATGDRLAFGSTTGSLWISDNGGDEWATISNHLPPVYAVRFG